MTKHMDSYKLCRRAGTRFSAVGLAWLGMVATLLMGAAAPGVYAQDLTHKAAKQTMPVALVNAAVYPVTAAPISNGYVIFEEGVITAFGEGSPASIPVGTLTIDFKGKRSIYPGLISPYTQVGLTEIQAVVQTVDIDEAGSVTPEVVAATAVNPDSTLIPVTRSNGILTTVVFPDGGIFAGQPSVMRLDGWTNPELTIRRSIGQVIRWPNMRTFVAWWMDDNEEEQRKAIQRNLKTVDDVMERAKGYIAASSVQPPVPHDLRYEALRAIFPVEGMPALGTVFIHANSVDQLVAVAAFAKKFDSRVVVLGGREAPLCAAVLKDAKIGVIVMGTHNLPARDDLPYDECFTLPLRLEQAGIPFAIAHGDDTAHERNLPYNAATAVAYGLSKESALASITIQPARFAGVEQTLGSIEVGKAATLIITDGDVLEATSNTVAAYIDGRAIDLSNKQTKLAEKYRARYKQNR